MKKLLYVFLLFWLVSSAMSAVFTDDFSVDPLVNGWGSSADGIGQQVDAVDGVTDYANIGWWWYDSIWKDTGATYAANTLYTMTVRTRDAGDGIGGSTSDVNGAFGTVEFGFSRADTWEKLVDLVNNPAPGAYGYQPNFTIPSTPGVFGDGTPWYEFSVTLDTADFPAAVGAPIGVEFSAVNGNVSAAWTSIDSMVVTPEPVSILLLGLGSLALRRRKR